MASLFQFSMYFWYIRIVGVNDAEGPPVPISNTEVKLSRAEDTCLETDRENRSTPTQETASERVLFFVMYRLTAGDWMGRGSPDGVPLIPLLFREWGRSVAVERQSLRPCGEPPFAQGRLWAVRDGGAPLRRCGDTSPERGGRGWVFILYSIFIGCGFL